MKNAVATGSDRTGKDQQDQAKYELALQQLDDSNDRNDGCEYEGNH